MGEPDDERAFDEYLDRALKGEPPDPADFARAHGAESEALRSALDRIWSHARGSAAGREGALPERIGEFRLLREIGAGGLGVVYLAEQPALGRQVALKIVRPELSGSAVAIERFRREARAVAQLHHPNIVTLYAAGEEHGVRFLAMEFVAGASLGEMLQAGELARVSIAQRVRWGAEIARALDYAHTHGVIHRDVKPSNIRVAEDGRALLVDFGLARTLDSAEATLTEAFAGSPFYASPEQISKSSAVDARSDVYSLGVTLYQALSGRAPFDCGSGGSIEQVFHRILTADAPPLRTLAPEIPRDLETVVHKAMERDVARRYATAGELASDLEAVVELRPIRGRPPSAFARLARAARRRPGIAAGIATAAVAVIGFASFTLVRAAAERSNARAQARAAVEDARGRIAGYRASRASVGDARATVRKLRDQLWSGRLTPEEYALLDSREEELENLERGWERTYYEVLDLLRHAERLDAAVDGVDAVRAELHFERYTEASDARDPSAADFYGDLVRTANPDGPLARALDAQVLLSLHTDPPGAEVHIYRYAELADLVPGGERRFVPVPRSGPDPSIAPGTWSLRVEEDAGELERGDSILAIGPWSIEKSVLVADPGDAADALAPLDRWIECDGKPIEDSWCVETLAPAPSELGASAPERDFVFERPSGERVHLRARGLDELGVRVATPWDFATDRDRPRVLCTVARGGERLERLLAPGVRVRPTAAPVPRSAASLAGTTPLEALPLRAGSYLLVLVLPDHEVVRLPVFLAHTGPPIVVRLDPLGSSPRDFVRVPGLPSAGGDEFWIMEREVTCAEYLEFLSDPAVAAEIEREGGAPTRLVPRQARGPSAEAYWERDANGELRPPEDWRLDWPVLGISWHDAMAYADWRNARARERGDPFEFALPTRAHLERAGLGGLAWNYAYGMHLRPKWSRSCFSHPTARPGPVLEHPVDESPFGVFDLTGSAFEWADDWYDESREMRFLGGGAWGQAHPDVLKVCGGYGAQADATSGETGVRLIARRIGPRASPAAPR